MPASSAARVTFPAVAERSASRNRDSNRRSTSSFNDLKSQSASPSGRSTSEGWRGRTAPPTGACRLASEGNGDPSRADGRPTRETESLAKECELIVHEAFSLDREVENHGNIMNCLEFAGRAGGKHLALVHLERTCRETAKKTVAGLDGTGGLHVFLPEPGDMFVL